MNSNPRDKRFTYNPGPPEKKPRFVYDYKPPAPPKVTGKWLKPHKPIFITAIEKLGNPFK